MSGSVVQIAQVVGLFLVLGMVHTGPAVGTSSRNKRQDHWLESGKCGPSNKLPDGRPGRCNPNGRYPCCSKYGWCGKTPGHCECDRCIDYRSSVCPRGFFNPSGSSSQCFKAFDEPHRNWTEARQWCIDNEMTLATPNDDVNLEELGQYIWNSTTVNWYSAWVGGRGSASGFLWEAGVGEQPGSSSGRRELDGHPGWLPADGLFTGHPGYPGDYVGNDYCLASWPAGRSTPYVVQPCSLELHTLCQQ